VPANGAATCDGTSCGVQCNSGFHLCGSACLSDTSVASCGSSCTPCPTTSHGTATCVAGACGFFCDAGYYPCPTGCAAINVDIQVAATSSTVKLGINLDMALTSSGHPVILYNDTGYHDQIVVWNGSSWSAPAYATVPMPYYYCKLALDSADMPHLACKDYVKDILHYLRWVSGAWVAEQVDSGYSFVDKPDIAIDSSNGVHFAYWNGYGLKYAKRQSAGVFTVEAVLSASSVPYPSLAVDSAGVPSVAVGFLNTGLRVATRDGAPWNVTSIEPTTSVGSVSLTVDSQKRPHVSYTALPGGDVVLKHVMRSGTSWPIQVVEQAPSLYMTAIATDAADRAIIGYFKVASSQNTLQIARWDGQAWRRMQVDPGVGSYSKLAAAVDGQGKSHLAFPRTNGSFTGEIDHAVIAWPTCP
jgi:hypothetical protein